MTRVVYVHGNQTTHWSFAWAADLQASLRDRGYDTVFETMPDSIVAREKYWLPFLSDHVGVGSNDVIVGWSSGAVAAMRYAESHRIAGSVLVAPCCTDLGDEDERASGYFDRPWQWDAIRGNQNKIFLVTAGDDPYIPQAEFDSIASGLHPERIHFDSGGHFIDQASFPEIVDCVSRIAPPS